MTVPIDLSPEAFRQLGYQAVDLIADALAVVREAPARRAVPDALRDRLMRQPLPQDETAPEALLARFAEAILPYPMGNGSPRFAAWVNSPPAPLGVIAALLAAGLNPSVAGGDHAATYIEHAVLGWMKAIVRFPDEAGSVLVSGGSAANLVCLGAMRHTMTDGTDRAAGWYRQTKPLIVYTSTQGHSCIQKALEILGFGRDHLRLIPVDDDFRMDVAALRAQITADRSAGLRPVCVAASAGTVNTGAIDPLAEIADLCAEEGLWFHIDGAYGGVAVLAQSTQGLYEGIERADSLAVDPHKWMYVPVDCGCALVKDAALLRDTYSVIPAYLRDDRALPWFSEYSIEQTRPFRALKVWMVLQQIGARGLGELIDRDIALARTLEAKIRAREDMEVVAGGPLSITCFRWLPRQIGDPARVDEINRRVAQHVNNSGRAFLNTTELDGRLVLRTCWVNFRTMETDLDALLDAVADAGALAISTAAPTQRDGRANDAPRS